MINFKQNLISHAAGIIDAMHQLDGIPDTLTLFILDDDEKLIGTLTDGDIRRGFIKGLDLKGRVRDFMITKYRTTIKNELSIRDFKAARDFGIRLLPELDEQGLITRVHDLSRRKSNLPLECMIMAGGRGERLRPLTDATPKPMLPLGGKPILDHNIDRLVSFGVEKIYISLRYLGQQIIDYFGDGSAKGIEIEYIWEDQPLGTAGALSLLKSVGSEYMILMNSDLLTDVDFEELYLQVIDRQADVGVASVTHTVKVPYGIFEEENQQIYGLKEKPVFTNYANAGIYILKSELISRVPKDTFYDITDLMDVLISEKRLLIHNPIYGYWIDIGQHQDYENAQEIMKHLDKSSE
jgi:dTDP-glucose pyrophosphorylase